MEAVGRLELIQIDCADPAVLAEFWSRVLGVAIDSVLGDPPHYVNLASPSDPPGGPTLAFQRVPEPKTVKNRLHLDISVDDVESATARVVALGGRRAPSQDFSEYGYRWRVMSDPDGNEFCLSTRDPEREGAVVAGPASVEDYFAELPPERRAVMETLRATIRAAAPAATETIGYRMPTFKLGGRFLVSYAAFAHHYSLFPASGAVVEALGDELAPYLSGKGTIRFAANTPIPAALVTKVVAVRIEEETGHGTGPTTG